MLYFCLETNNIKSNTLLTQDFCVSNFFFLLLFQHSISFALLFLQLFNFKGLFQLNINFKQTDNVNHTHLYIWDILKKKHDIMC